MGTANDLYDVVMAHMGTEGGQEYWSWLMGYDYVSPGGTPYCACGVSKMLHDADVRCPHFPDPVAFDWRNDDLEGRAHDRWSLGFMWPISFDWDKDGRGDHVGFFIEYLDDGLCRTAEFNTGPGGGQNLVQIREVSKIVLGIEPYFDEEEEEMTEEDKRDIARYCAEYCFGDEDKARNLNMYNQSRWTFTYLELIKPVVDAIKATTDAIKATTDAIKAVVDKISEKLDRIIDKLEA